MGVQLSHTGSTITNFYISLLRFDIHILPMKFVGQSNADMTK